MQVIPTTLWILPNEKAMGLLESYEPMPGQGWRRVQKVYVIRNDNIAEWRRDLGAQADYVDHTGKPADGFHLPAYLAATVAELQDDADELRQDTDRAAVKFMDEVRAESAEQFTRHFADRMQAKNEALQNRSKFGPGISTQRNR